MSKITLVVVDDHPLFRQGVVDAFLLEKDFKVLGQAASGNEALTMIKELLPQVTRPLVDLTFLIEGERILVFAGEVLINKGQSFIRFDVKSLRDQVEEVFPDLYGADGDQKAALG